VLVFPSVAISDQDTREEHAVAEDERLRTFDNLLERIAAQPTQPMLSEVYELAALTTQPVVASHASWAFSLIESPAVRREHKDRYLTAQELSQCKDRPYLYETLATRRSLGNDRYREAVEVFSARLRSADPCIKEKAAWFLGWVLRAGDVADEIVEVGLSSNNDAVRIAIAESLGYLGDSRAEQFLTPFLEGETDFLRLRAATIWANGAGLARPLPISVAQRLVDSENPSIGKGTLGVLDDWLRAKRLIGNQEEKARLMDAITMLAAEASEPTALFAVSALSEGRSYFSSQAHVDICTDKVWKRYEDAGPALKAAILRMEADLRSGKCVDCLIKGLHDIHPDVLRSSVIKLGTLYDNGRPALPYLGPLLNHPVENVRVSAALAVLRILGKIKEAPPGDVVSMARAELSRNTTEQR